jgi:hypothetical protein
MLVNVSDTFDLSKKYLLSKLSSLFLILLFNSHILGVGDPAFLSKTNVDNDNYEDKAIGCGAFDKYLITNFGIEKFSASWRNIENEKIFLSTYNKSMDDLEKDFYAFLETVN